MSKRVRVRFAPSPTGPLHIGGLRTALFNYLFAKKNNGDFIVRIEDTDQKRHVEGSEKHMLDSLEWCGLQIDEGPYRQSARNDFYKEKIQELLSLGYAYYAFDTEEELEEHRKSHKEKGKSNSFFYVSSSEWNLYDFIVQFTKLQNLPKAVIKLKDIKTGISDFLTTGGGNHDHKFVKIKDIISFYPKQQYVLLGDDSQHDAYIYERICKIFPLKSLIE